MALRRTSLSRKTPPVRPSSALPVSWAPTARSVVSTRLRRAAERKNMKRNAPMPFPGATVDSITLFDRGNHAIDPTISYIERGGDAAKPAGTLRILTLPALFRGSGSALNGLIDQLQRADARTLPIDAGEIITTGAASEELRLTLPEGWKAQLPETINA